MTTGDQDIIGDLFPYHLWLACKKGDHGGRTATDAYRQAEFAVWRMLLKIQRDILSLTTVQISEVANGFK